MHTSKRKPLQPLQPHDTRPFPPSRLGGTSGTSASSSSAVGLGQAARTPPRLAELHGNALEERRARRFQEPGKDVSRKGGTKPIFGPTTRNATAGPGSGPSVGATEMTRGVVAVTALPKFRESDSGKRRRDASPAASEVAVAPALAPLSPPARKRARVAHGAATDGEYLNDAAEGGLLVDGEGHQVGKRCGSGDEDRDEDGDEYGEEDGDESGSEYQDEDEDDPEDEVSEDEDSTVIHPATTRPRGVPVSMRLQSRLVMQEAYLHGWEEADKRTSTRSKGKEVITAGEATVKSTRVSTGRVGKGGRGRAAPRDSEEEDSPDEEGAETADPPQEDKGQDDGDGGAESEDEGSEYEGSREPPRRVRSSTGTRMPMSMRLQSKMVQKAVCIEVVGVTREDMEETLASDESEKGANFVVDGEEEDDYEEGSDEDDVSSDASEEDSEYSHSHSPPPRHTTRSTQSSSSRDCSRGPVSMRLQQKAVLEREAGATNVNETSGGRRSHARFSKGADAHRVQRAIPTSTRLQEKKLREGEFVDVDVDDTQKAVGGDRTAKRVHWQPNARAERSGSTPISMRLQAKMAEEMQKEGPGSVENGTRGPVGEDEGGGDDDDYEEEDLTVSEEEDETWEEESEFESEPESESSTAAGGSQAWLSGARATRATRKALKKILGSRADDEESEGEVDEDGDGCGGEGAVGDCGDDPVTEDLRLRETEGACLAMESAAVTKGGKHHVCQVLDKVDSGEACQLIAPPHCGLLDEVNACQTRRRSSRIADLDAQRCPLPNPPYVPKPRASNSRLTSKPATSAKHKGRGRRKAKGKTIDVYVDESDSVADEEEEALEMERQRYEEDVRRIKLGYPPRGRTEAPPVDYNAKNPVDWETSLGRKVWMRMQELGYGCADACCVDA